MRWHFIQFTAFTLTMAVLGGVTGCGDGGESSSSPTSTDKPAEGKAVSKASQLLGTWFSEANHELVGIEFLEGGKVMLMYGQRGQDIVTMDYSLLDGGRLSVVGPGGLTMLFDVKIAGDQLQMAEANKEETQRLRRLTGDETIASALQEKAERRRREAAEQAERNRHQADALVQAAAKLLTGGHATVKPKDPQKVTTPHAALEIESVENNQITGFAYFNMPGRKHALTGRIVPNPGNGMALVQLQFGNQVEPPHRPMPAFANPSGFGQSSVATGAPDPARQTTKLTMNFEVSGDPSDPALATTVGFGGGQPVEMVLTDDQTLHANLVEALANELRIREKSIAPIANVLKDRAYLTASYPMPSFPKQVETLHVILHRGDANNDFTGELWTVGSWSATPGIETGRNVNANIHASTGFPRLLLTALIRTNDSRQYLFDRVDEQTGTLTGQWRQHNSNQWQPIELHTKQAWTADEWQAEADARKTLLYEKLTSNAPLRGAIVANMNRQYVHLPVELSLAVSADGTITGDASFPSVVATGEVKGSVEDSSHGPKLALQIGDGKGTQDMGIPALQWLQSGLIHLTPRGADEPAALTGYFQYHKGAAAGSKMDACLIATDTQRATDLRRRIERKMDEGVTFMLSAPLATNRHDHARVQLKRDPTSGRITGQFDDHGRVVGAAPPATLVGELGEDDGWATLTIQVVQPEGTPGPASGYKLHFVEYGDELRMLGVYIYNNQRYSLLEFVEPRE